MAGVLDEMKPKDQNEILVLDKAGFEGMAMVAIDEDWAAKRLRRREFIKRQ